MYPKKRVNNADNKDATTKEAKEESSGRFNGILDKRETEIYLQVVPVVLKAGGRTVNSYALLDSGSQISLVRDSVANKLGLKGKQSHINVGTIKEAPERLSAREVELFVMSCLAVGM